MRWLIAEDDKALSHFLARALPAEGDTVVLAGDGQEALTHIATQEPGLLILDLDLPVVSGFEVLRMVRELSPLCPVLVVSGRADEETRIACLNQGADDCLQKPFSVGELRARCAAILRRQQLFQNQLEREAEDTGHDPESILRHGLLEVERYTRRVRVSGEPVHLTNREFALLEQLLHADGEPISRTVLRDRLWVGEAAVETSVVDVHLGALRRKLAAHPGAPLIETVRGAGFCFQARVMAAETSRSFASSPRRLHA